MRLIVAIALALCLVLPLPAQAAVTIEGDVECADWVKWRTKSGSDILEGYVIGLLNGLSIARDVEFWQVDGRRLSRESVALWMDKYCRDNPLSSPVYGVRELFKERTGTGWRP
jgi:hypothetical protein